MELQPTTSLPAWHLIAILVALYALTAWPTIGAGQLPLIIALLSLILAVTLIALSTIDLQTFRLPDAITLPLTVAGCLLAFLLAWDDPLWHVVAAATGFGTLYALAEIYRWARGRDGLGLGDAKLFGAAGSWLGLQGLPSVLLWATGTAIAAVCITALLRRRLEADTPIAFGPFLALGFWLVWLYGPVV